MESTATQGRDPERCSAIEIDAKCNSFFKFASRTSRKSRYPPGKSESLGRQLVIHPRHKTHAFMHGDRRHVPCGDRYHSITYPQGGFELLHGKRLHLSKIGHIKIKRHREMKGKIKTCTIKREGEQWYAIVTCEYKHDRAMTFHPSEEEIGVDLGVKVFAMLSTGEAIENPRHYRVEEDRIADAHRTIHRRKKGSHRRNRAKKELSRLSRKTRNRRRDFHHKASRKLVNRYLVIVFEDLQITNLTATPKPKQDSETGKYIPNGAAAKAGLNKSILNAGWGHFVQLCVRKAEEAGGTVVKVSPHNTSQVCHRCGTIVPKTLSERWHSCPECGEELDRDHNSALEVLHRYQRTKKM